MYTVTLNFLPMFTWDPLRVLCCVKMAFLTEFLSQTMPPSSVNVALDQYEAELTVATPVS